MLLQAEKVQPDAAVITRIRSPYQDIVLMGEAPDVRLFIDGDLQLSTLDEYRYHEALVHPVISATQTLKRQNGSSGLTVLLLGAGDGMALREVLKWSEVERVVLIDLDPAVVDLARCHPALVDVNLGAFEDERVEIQFADAFVTLPAMSETFDVIIADFPDPNDEVVAKLYTTEFYHHLLSRLSTSGVFVTQSSSPFYAPGVMDCIQATLASVGFNVYPYVVEVPSFGPWGFTLATQQVLEIATLDLPVATRFLTRSTLHHLFDLPRDIQLGNAEINRLSHPVIVEYELSDRWDAYSRADLED